MRIVAGDFRGRAIHAPEGLHARPTTDRVREALFNVIDHGDRPAKGARVLDLFAGSGALGLEALSRGAAFALFVDDNAKSRAAIRRNVEELGLTGHTKIYRRDAVHLGECPSSFSAPFDLVFLDPPYGKGLIEKALASLTEGNWLSDDVLIVCECGRKEEVDLAPFALFDERHYGDTKVLFAKR
ncbi:MAG: 16S rRNA (guanine(966)-N(2))-methyltransferase RsmD [Alphaproteobacteria bacterium]|nr:MAG: 16S rRNA (guanine(966)-N(2))-methyltransferase RsmD [Alphaproteobacteria bacterium]